MQRETDGRTQLPATLAQDEKLVERGFWKKLRKLAGKIPFTEELAAAYYCASDPATPTRVRGVLFGALAYFVVPLDAVPDLLAGVGFTDDATVLALAVAMVSRHLKPQHRAQARAALGLPPETSPEK